MLKNENSYIYTLKKGKIGSTLMIVVSTNEIEKEIKRREAA